MEPELKYCTVSVITNVQRKENQVVFFARRQGSHYPVGSHKKSMKDFQNIKVVSTKIILGNGEIFRGLLVAKVSIVNLNKFRQQLTSILFC